MKKLVIEVQKKNGKINGRVQVQTHRRDDFGVAGSRDFHASNGIRLCSSASPEWSRPDNTLYVRGGSSPNDNSIFEVPDEGVLSKLRVAVKEYNEAFSDGRRYETIY